MDDQTQHEAPVAAEQAQNGLAHLRTAIHLLGMANEKGSPLHSRELSLTITNAETALLWGERALARDPE